MFPSHDRGDVHPDEISQVKEIVEKEMGEAFRLDVPLKVDVSLGNNWYECDI